MKTSSGLGRFALSSFYALIIIAGLGLVFGPKGYAAGTIFSILFVAWRHDNQVGVLLPLAVLFVIILLIMFLLIYLMMIIHH